MSGDTALYAQTLQAYSEAGLVDHVAVASEPVTLCYNDTLSECGFEVIATYPSLFGTLDPDQDELFVILARKRETR